ncbi:hypothetical protein KI387_022298, partial [Taxus chinensis]
TLLGSSSTGKRMRGALPDIDPQLKVQSAEQKEKSGLKYFERTKRARVIYPLERDVKTTKVGNIPVMRGHGKEMEEPEVINSVPLDEVQKTLIATLAHEVAKSQVK